MEEKHASVKALYEQSMENRRKLEQTLRQISLHWANTNQYEERKVKEVDEEPRRQEAKEAHVQPECTYERG
jgi:hypothetical protein